MTNREMLKSTVFDKKYTLKELAEAIGINSSTLYRKLKNNGESFSVGEVKRIKEALNLTTQEAVDIFFRE